MPELAGEERRAIREQYLRLAVPAGVEKDFARRWYDFKLGAMKTLAGPLVAKQLRPRPIAADAARSPIAEENAPAAGAA